jgi:hypothetical protein
MFPIKQATNIKVNNKLKPLKSIGKAIKNITDIIEIEIDKIGILFIIKKPFIAISKNKAISKLVPVITKDIFYLLFLLIIYPTLINIIINNPTTIIN